MPGSWNSCKVKACFPTLALMSLQQAQPAKELKIFLVGSGVDSPPLLTNDTLAAMDLNLTRKWRVTRSK